MYKHFNSVHSFNHPMMHPFIVNNRLRTASFASYRSVLSVARSLSLYMGDHGDSMIRLYNISLLQS